MPFLPSISILPPPIETNVCCATFVSLSNTSIIIVFGCSTAVFISKMISHLLAPNVFKMILSVRCPFPVSAKEPNKVILKCVASGYCSLIYLEAIIGPNVCELLGPGPIL